MRTIDHPKGISESFRISLEPVGVYNSAIQTVHICVSHVLQIIGVIKNEKALVLSPVNEGQFPVLSSHCHICRIRNSTDIHIS